MVFSHSDVYRCCHCSVSVVASSSFRVFILNLASRRLRRDLFSSSAFFHFFSQFLAERLRICVCFCKDSSFSWCLSLSSISARRSRLRLSCISVVSLHLSSHFLISLPAFCACCAEASRRCCNSSFSSRKTVISIF